MCNVYGIVPNTAKSWGPAGRRQLLSASPDPLADGAEPAAAGVAAAAGGARALLVRVRHSPSSGSGDSLKPNPNDTWAYNCDAAAAAANANREFYNGRTVPCWFPDPTDPALAFSGGGGPPFALTLRDEPQQYGNCESGALASRSESAALPRSCCASAAHCA